MSHPIWVRGLKRKILVELIDRIESHPIWVRGLKLVVPKIEIGKSRRTLYGCVD